MTAFVERIVQRLTEAAPIQTAVSTLVGDVLETTATKLSRGAPLQFDDGQEQDAA